MLPSPWTIEEIITFGWRGEKRHMAMLGQGRKEMKGKVAGDVLVTKEIIRDAP